MKKAYRVKKSQEIEQILKEKNIDPVPLFLSIRKNKPKPFIFVMRSASVKNWEMPWKEIV